MSSGPTLVEMWSRLPADERAVVAALVDALVDGDDSALDHVQEMADAIGDRFGTIVRKALSDLRRDAPGRTLAEEVARLRSDLEELRRQLATEVRTRRLVVVTEDGFERVTAEAEAFYGSVKVSSTRGGMHVELNANEQSVEASAEVFVSAGGNIVGQLGVIEQGDLLPSSGPDGWSHLDPGTLSYKTGLTIMPFAGDEPYVSVGLDGLRVR